jgi:hypothetical protein
VAGFPELPVFAQLSSYAKFLFGKGLIGEIYRPAAEVIVLPHLSETRRDILEATSQAGRELVQSMQISQATMERITQPMGGDFDSFADMANMFWKSCIQEGLTPREFHEKHFAAHSDSLDARPTEEEIAS